MKLGASQGSEGGSAAGELTHVRTDSTCAEETAGQLPTCREAVEFGGLGVSAIVLHGERGGRQEEGAVAVSVIVEVFKAFSMDWVLQRLVEQIIKIFQSVCMEKSSWFPGTEFNSGCGADHRHLLLGQGPPAF